MATSKPESQEINPLNTTKANVCVAFKSIIYLIWLKKKQSTLEPLQNYNRSRYHRQTSCP